MPTACQYGPYCDRKGVTKTARKMSEDGACDTFVTATANGKYMAWSADFPGDKMLPGYTVVEEFKYVPPIPEQPRAACELMRVLRALHYELFENPAPEDDGGAGAEDLRSLMAEAFDLGLLDAVRGAE